MIGESLNQTPRWVRMCARTIRALPRGRYPLMNLLCRRPIKPFIHPLGITQGRMRFVCDPRDGISREACFMGYYEPQETVLVQNLLRPGMCFVDVGANWGYYTLLGADLVGPTGRVVSFEPHPTLYSLLERNLSMNGLACTILPIAVADKVGEMTLTGFDQEDGNWGVSKLVASSERERPEFRVRTGLLETLLDDAGVDEVDLLKIDIEGAEALVIPTIKRGLAQGRYKRILLELHPPVLSQQGVSSEILNQQILDHGYRGFTIDHTPQVYRSAAYHLPRSAATFLSHLDGDARFAAWPHVLFLAPGVQPSW